MSKKLETCALCGKNTIQASAKISKIDQIMFDIPGPFAHHTCLDNFFAKLKQQYPECIEKRQFHIAC